MLVLMTVAEHLSRHRTSIAARTNNTVDVVDRLLRSSFLFGPEKHVNQIPQSCVITIFNAAGRELQVPRSYAGSGGPVPSSGMKLGICRVNTVNFRKRCLRPYLNVISASGTQRPKVSCYYLSASYGPGPLRRSRGDS